MGGCLGRSASLRINVLVVARGRPSLGLLALPVHSTGRCISWNGALIVGSTCEGRTSDHARRCARGKEEEGTGCCGHFERPTWCAFNAAWAASLNITWLMRPHAARDRAGLPAGLLHKSLLCYVASGRMAWRKGACAALAHPSCCVCVGQVMGAPAGTRTCA